MATATVIRVWCLTSSAGVEALDAFAGLDRTIRPEQLDGLVLDEFVMAKPGVATAIDNARPEPDNVFLTVDTSGDIDQALWPGAGGTVDMSAGQSVWPGVSVAAPATLSIYDHDRISASDLVGAVTILLDESGAGEITKLAISVAERSAYYVTYRVDR
ncbi:hypothetical protein [Pseudonocardia sp. TRM90224]|uniref:hypothetical protein n=1 Tax=Pseudonocardia sp. TRM90224 TaxID=2812678 RepID=UPI001E4AB8CE|nr:hypothetical protein [Pseudonocardia sp. TRM90224]